MRTKNIRNAITVAAVVVLSMAIFAKLNESAPPVNIESWMAVEMKDEKVDASLDHRRDVYIHALEWCESRGYNTAINEKDRDGTASYYNFQWKPSTFKGYAVKYKMLSADLEESDYFNWMSDYDMQHAILEKMVRDKDVVWSNEFPDCVNKKIGAPPKK